MSVAERDRFLEAINDLCGDTYCEGEFGYDFLELECEFDAAVCAIGYEMVTDSPTRAEISPRKVRSEHGYHGPVFGAITAVVPPSKCDRYEAGLEEAGPPCTIVQAACILTPIRSAAEFEQLHWEKLSDCVSVIEDAVLDRAP